MNKHLLISLLLLTVFTLHAQVKTNPPPYLTKSLTNETIRNITAETSGGSISVKSVNASEARIEVYISSNNRKADLSNDEIEKRLKEDYTLHVSVTNNELTAIAKPKERFKDWRNALNISFRVFVPHNVSTNLATSGGSIHLEGITGTQDFRTSGGSLHVENVGGKITGRTSGGSIHLSNSKENMDLSTSGGSINASNCNGKLKLSTSGGSLKLSALNGFVDATTSGGSVFAEDITGELLAHTSGGNVVMRDLSCSLETSTNGGNIDVAIKEFGKYVKISNSAGNVDLQIPSNKGLDLNLHADKIKTDALNNFNGTNDEDKIKGKLNGGGIPVTVDAGSGKINLAFKN